MIHLVLELLARFFLLISSPFVVTHIGKPMLWLFRRKAPAKLPPLEKIQNVLVIHLGELSQVILSTPFLAELRRLCPKAGITLVVRRGITSIVENCPYADEIATYDCNDTNNAWERFKLRRRALRLGSRHLWSKKYELALVPRWDLGAQQDRYIAFFSGASTRLGFEADLPAGSQAQKSADNQLFTQVLPVPKEGHLVERICSLLSVLGPVEKKPLEIWEGDRDERVISETFRHHAIERSTPLVAIGVDGLAKRHLWPTAQFIQLASWIIREYQARVLWMGFEGDKDRAAYLMEAVGPGTVSLVGQFNPRQMGALIQKTQLFIGGLGTTTQLALACRRPTILLSCHPKDGEKFADDAPATIGPWMVAAKVLQPPTPRPPCQGFCSGFESHCIHGIALADVQQAVREIFQPGLTENAGRHSGVAVEQSI